MNTEGTSICIETYKIAIIPFENQVSYFYFNHKVIYTCTCAYTCVFLKELNDTILSEAFKRRYMFIQISGKTTITIQYFVCISLHFQIWSKLINKIFGKKCASLLSWGDF